MINGIKGNNMTKKIDLGMFVRSRWTNEYILQNEPYLEQIKRAAEVIKDADYVLIGAGAGFSAAAGLEYSGKRFTENFKEFIDKYGMTDMYSSGFYPFPTQEAKWGYWSKHSMVNRINPPALPLYLKLLDIVKSKDYFVLTTNVDHQFYKAGFDDKRIFATQGDYGKIQCKAACHDKTYDAVELFEDMDKVRHDCLIPSSMVPKCPVCGGDMNMNLRSDGYFVEDESWNDATERYGEFLEKIKNGKTVLLELGVGFNTPIIIRYPFDRMTRDNESSTLIRINNGQAVVPASISNRCIGIDSDLVVSINDISSLI